MSDLQAEYAARLVATSYNLKQHVNQAIGVIQSSQKGDMPEEEAMAELDKLDDQWAKIIVDDIAPQQHIIKEL